MAKSYAQTRLALTIERSGMTEKELATVLGVSQPTVSRLKTGKIVKVSVYQQKLDAHLGSKGQEEFAELIALARSSPDLREALIALQRLIHNIA